MSEAEKKVELERINGPRVKRACDQLKFIATSAKSLKAHELDVAELVAPVAEALSALRDADAVEILEGTPHPDEEAIRRASAYIDETVSFSGGMTTKMSPPGSLSDRLEGLTLLQLASMVEIIAARIADAAESASDR